MEYLSSLARKSNQTNTCQKGLLGGEKCNWIHLTGWGVMKCSIVPVLLQLAGPMINICIDHWFPTLFMPVRTSFSNYGNYLGTTKRKKKRKILNDKNHLGKVFRDGIRERYCAQNLGITKTHCL